MFNRVLEVFREMYPVAIPTYMGVSENRDPSIVP